MHLSGLSRDALRRLQKFAQQIRTEGMWDYTEEFQMSNPMVAGRPVRLRKPHDESWLEAARHSMCVMEVLDPKMSEQKGRGQGSGWLDLQTIRTDDIDYLPPEYIALFDSELPSRFQARKRAQWEVDESGQAVPMGSPGAQGDSSDMSSRLTTLEQMVREYGSTFQEWVDYLSQYNKGLADSLSAIWTDVNTIGNDVDQLRQEKQQTALQTTPQTKTKPKNKAWDTYTQTAEKTK